MKNLVSFTLIAAAAAPVAAADILTDNELYPSAIVLEGRYRYELTELSCEKEERVQSASDSAKPSAFGRWLTQHVKITIPSLLLGSRTLHMTAAAAMSARQRHPGLPPRHGGNRDNRNRFALPCRPHAVRNLRRGRGSPYNTTPLDSEPSI